MQYQQLSESDGSSSSGDSSSSNDDENDGIGYSNRVSSVTEEGTTSSKSSGSDARQSMINHYHLRRVADRLIKDIYTNEKLLGKVKKRQEAIDA
jgi:hypothetical protein